MGQDEGAKVGKDNEDLMVFNQDIFTDQTDPTEISSIHFGFSDFRKFQIANSLNNRINEGERLCKQKAGLELERERYEQQQYCRNLCGRQKKAEE